MKENFEKLASDIRRKKFAYGGKGDGEIDPILVSIENKIQEQFPESKIITNEDYLFLPMYGDGVNDSIDISRIKSIISEFYGGLEQADDQSGFIITAPPLLRIIHKYNRGQISIDKLLSEDAFRWHMLDMYDYFVENDPIEARGLFIRVLDRV